MDAAIAANAALGLMEPVSCGIGGDLFAIVWDPKTKRLYGYNGSGRSPRGRSYADMKRKLAGRDYVPGLRIALGDGAGHGRCLVCAAWTLRQAADGRDLLAPAIAYARDGFPVTQYISALWRANMVSLSQLTRRRRVRERAEDLSHQRRAAGSGPDLQESRSREELSGAWRKAGAMRSTRARSRARWTPISAASAAICVTTISPRIAANGSIRSRSTIAATTSTNCRRTARAARRFRCSRSSKATISRPWGRARPMRCIS